MSTLSDRVSTVADTTVTEWCDRHGLIHELTPFESRTSDRIEVARQLNTGIADLPETASTFVPRDLLDGDVGHGGWLETIVLMTGAWPHPEHDVRWVNPNYIHLDALPTMEVDREAHLRRCASLGVLTRADVAPRFGVTTESLERWLTRHEFSWFDHRKEGIRRFARTLYVAADWGRTQQEVAAFWPRKAGTIRKWIYRYGCEEGFHSPADPSRGSNFTEGQQ